MGRSARAGSGRRARRARGPHSATRSASSRAASTTCSCSVSRACARSTRSPSATRARVSPTTACSCASCPLELFAERRTFPHDLFGKQEVEAYLDNLDWADRRAARRARRRRNLRRVRLAATGRPSPRARVLAGSRSAGRRADSRHRRARRRRSVRASGADARLRRTTTNAPRSRASRRSSASCWRRPTARRASSTRSRQRWSDTPEPGAGIAGDVVLLHIATMTNLFAALGWTLAQVLLHPSDCDARACALEVDPARASGRSCCARCCARSSSPATTVEPRRADRDDASGDQRARRRRRTTRTVARPVAAPRRRGHDVRARRPSLPGAAVLDLGDRADGRPAASDVRPARRGSTGSSRCRCRSAASAGRPRRVPSIICAYRVDSGGTRSS